MISNELGIQLHHKWAQGESLTAVEQEQLAAWYAVQDEQERQEVHIPQSTIDLVALQAQVDAAVARMTVLTQQIQEKSAENNTLRREIAALRQQLASQKQPA